LSSVKAFCLIITSPKLPDIHDLDNEKLHSLLRGFSSLSCNWWISRNPLGFHKEQKKEKTKKKMYKNCENPKLSAHWTLRLMRISKVVGGTVTHHFLNAKPAFLSEKPVLSLHYLQDTLEHGNFTRDSENPGLFKPELFLSFSEQHVKGFVTQILGWYNEPAKLHANTNSNVALGNNTARSSSLTFRQRKCSFQKFYASAGVTVVVVVVVAVAVAACSWRVCNPSPFLKNLLKPHYVPDLVGFLSRIHVGETLWEGLG